MPAAAWILTSSTATAKATVLPKEYPQIPILAASIFVCFSVELLQTSQGLEACPSLPHDYALCFPRSRVPYLHEAEHGLEPGKQPPHSSMFIHLPNVSKATTNASRPTTFELEFSKFGRVITPR